MFFGVFEADFVGSKISKTAEVFAVYNMSESAKPATTVMEGAPVPQCSTSVDNVLSRQYVQAVLRCATRGFGLCRASM